MKIRNRLRFTAIRPQGAVLPKSALPVELERNEEATRKAKKALLYGDLDGEHGDVGFYRVGVKRRWIPSMAVKMPWMSADAENWVAILHELRKNPVLRPHIPATVRLLQGKLGNRVLMTDLTEKGKYEVAPVYYRELAWNGNKKPQVIWYAGNKKRTPMRKKHVQLIERLFTEIEKTHDIKGEHAEFWNDVFLAQIEPKTNSLVNIWIVDVGLLKKRKGIA